MKKPKVTDADMLESAARRLNELSTTQYVIKPWRSIMNASHAVEVTPARSGRRATDPIIEVPVANLPTTIEEEMTKANADLTASLRKTAVKNAAAKGIIEPKHKPGESAPGVKGLFPAAKVGVDKTPVGVVQSSVDSDKTTPGVNTMTEKTTELPKAQADKEAAAKQKIADKQAKIDAAAKAKAEKEAAAATAKEAKAKEAEAKKAQTAEERKAKAEKLAADRLAALGPDSKRTYVGSMLALADRVKAGVYTKGMTGQLRSNDDLAVALDAVPTDNVIALAMKALHLTVNPYAALNRGQQSMNLRNKLRGAIRADEGMGLIVVPGTDTTPAVRCTLNYIKTIRDENGYATAEDAATKKAEAKAAREKAAAEKKAAAQAAKDKAAAEKAAAKTEAKPAEAQAAA